MTFTRLPWRIGLPFAAFVLAGSAALVIWMGLNLAAEERARFEKLARTNADFINRVRLPASPRMAEELAQVLGTPVFFRHGDTFTPGLKTSLREIIADGHLHRTGSIEGVSVRLASGDELILARPAFASWTEVWNARTYAVLGAFWLLALVFAWLVSRSLVLPLRHLAAKLPDIEKPEPMELPETLRKDEIGDVARAFVRTREALQNEREQRARAEKLAVLGRMTAALAHEIQNPVAAIKMHAQLWRADADQPAQIIEGEAARIENLVNQWMFLSRPEPPAMSAVDVEKLLVDSLANQRLQTEHSLVRTELRAEAGLVIQGDHRRLAQVFSNLITNAIQSMPRGGTLAISARRAGSLVEVIFNDSGHGFSGEALKHFAEFFYSEKEGGMGIGLSVADEIVQAHGGALRAMNRSEGGACVTVVLPDSSCSLPPSS